MGRLIKRAFLLELVEYIFTTLISIPGTYIVSHPLL